MRSLVADRIVVKTPETNPARRKPGNARPLARPAVRRSPETGSRVAPDLVSALLAALPDAALAVDRRWRIRAFNAAAARLTGPGRGLAHGRSLWAAFPELRGSPAERALREALAGRPMTDSDQVIELGRPLTLRAAPYARGLVLTFSVPDEPDATARLLAESESRFRATFEQAAVGIAHVGLDGRWLRVNDRLCEITGYPRAELLTKTFQEITHPDDLADDLAQLEALLAGRIPTYAIEKRYLRQDGSVVWINLTVTLVRDEVGNPRYFISVVADTDEQKQAALARDESRTRLNLALEAAQLGTWDIDLRTDVIEGSDRYRVIMGLPLGVPLTRADAIARMHPDDRSPVIAAFTDAISAKRSYTAEYRIMKPDQTVHWIAASGQPMYEQGRPVRVVGIALDITARRDHDARQRFLVELYERLRRTPSPEQAAAAVAREMLEFFGFARTLFAEIDRATGAQTVIADERAAAHTGAAPFPLAELAHGKLGAAMTAGQTVVVRDVRRDPRTAGASDAFTRVETGSFIAVPLQTEGAWAATLVATDAFPRAWRPDKVQALRSAAEHLWLALENQRLYHDAVAALAARDASLAALGESEARFRRLSEANIFGLYFWHEDGRILDANDAFLALIGAERADLVAGRIDWIALTPPAWREADQRAQHELRTTGACSPFEKELRRQDGEFVPVLIAAAAFPGHTEGIAIVIDLSERKAQERFEQEFLAGIAHDLKNPLAAAKAQAQLMHRRLRQGRLSEQVADDGLEAIETNVNRVARRIEELMDIALLRSGRTLDLFREPVDLGRLARARVETYRHTTDRHAITLTAPDEPLIGEWDLNRIERAIDDLLGNAIKYSPHGGEIALNLTRETDRAGHDWAVLTVSDHGVGIPAGDLPHIFTRFRRGSNVQGRVRGTGIGLAGVRLLVEQHGGSIAVESTEGAGSTFAMRLPL